MVKQIHKKIIKILWQCESCHMNWEDRAEAEAHEQECYEACEKE